MEVINEAVYADFFWSLVTHVRMLSLWILALVEVNACIYFKALSVSTIVLVQCLTEIRLRRLCLTGFFFAHPLSHLIQ